MRAFLRTVLAAAVLALVLYAHAHAGAVRLAVVSLGIAVAAGCAVCALAGFAAARQQNRPPARRTRLAGAGQPAGRRLESEPADRRPADYGWPDSARPQRQPDGWQPPAGPCGSCFSRPAVTDRAGWQLCGPCAEGVDAVAAHAHEVADAEIARLAVERARQLAEADAFEDFVRGHADL